VVVVVVVVVASIIPVSAIAVVGFRQIPCVPVKTKLRSTHLRSHEWDFAVSLQGRHYKRTCPSISQLDSVFIITRDEVANELASL
jgi:hypothetical protein